MVRPQTVQGLEGNEALLPFQRTGDWRGVLSFMPAAYAAGAAVVLDRAIQGLSRAWPVALLARTTGSDHRVAGRAPRLFCIGMASGHNEYVSRAKEGSCTQIGEL